jgi:hypothetical protein
MRQRGTYTSPMNSAQAVSLIEAMRNHGETDAIQRGLYFTRYHNLNIGEEMGNASFIFRKTKTVYKKALLEIDDDDAFHARIERPSNPPDAHFLNMGWFFSLNDFRTELKFPKHHLGSRVIDLGHSGFNESTLRSTIHETAELLAVECMQRRAILLEKAKACN